MIEAKGKDKRGNGTAAANVTATLTAAGADSTEVTVKTDLNVTGKPAQFGRGVMQDVSDKLLGQFATCLETKLGGPDAVAATAAPDAAQETTPIAAEAAAATKTSSSPPTSSPTTPPTTSPSTTQLDPNGQRRASPDEPAAELDLGATVLPVLLKRYAPHIVGGLVAVWILRKLLRRHRH